MNLWLSVSLQQSCFFQANCYVYLQTKVNGGKRGEKTGEETGALYERWSKQQKRRVPVTGAAEGRGATFDAGLADRCDHIATFDSNKHLIVTNNILSVT